jgi:signal transduction histidine kinase
MKLETDQSRFESYIDMQEKSVKKLDRFIRDIINLSRNSRLGVAIEQIKFRSLVQSLFENHKYTENAAQIVKTVHIKGKAPFYSDLQRVSVILSNLISNSVKYANYSKDQSELDVHITLNEECAIIEVTDNGVGIAPEHIGKIFKMFFRASHDDSGSGLGLYIVKDTVEKLSGKISVRSELRKGTTFTVVLPNFKERFDSLGNLECDV